MKKFYFDEMGGQLYLVNLRNSKAFVVSHTECGIRRVN